MTNPHHQANLERYEKRIGLHALKELAYRLDRGDNTTQLCKEYGFTKYEIRYFLQVPSDLHCYIYERSQVSQLRLVYSAVA